MSRWKTYADGRRPSKHKLIEDLVPLVHDGNEVVDELTITKDKLTKDLYKLRTETLAILLEKVPAKAPSEA